MARDIKLSWTNPASVGDIDTIEVYRKEGDHTDVADFASFRTDAVLVTSEAVGTAGQTQEFTETAVPSGVYTYGAFSKNTVGFGTGDLTDSITVIS